MSSTPHRDRLAPSSLPAAGQEQGNEQGAELSGSATALLARVRQRRQEEKAPDGLRQRALARALAEAHRPAVLAMPAPALVPVARPTARALVRGVAALALGLGVVLGAPVAMHEIEQRVSPEAVSPEVATGNWQASGPAGELLSKHSPLFRLPLLPLSEAPRELAPSLFAEQPFAQESGSWQVRLWNDPTVEPETPAKVQFENGALCVPLAAGDRVLGGWPWPHNLASAQLQATAPVAAAPVAAVRLQQGRAYRLSFQAWARGPLPSQVLLGVGHKQFPFVAAAAARVQVSRSPEAFALDFVAARDDDAAGVAFLATNIAGHADPTRLCLRELRLSER